MAHFSCFCFPTMPLYHLCYVVTQRSLIGYSQEFYVAIIYRPMLREIGDGLRGRLVYFNRHQSTLVSSRDLAKLRTVSNIIFSAQVCKKPVTYDRRIMVEAPVWRTCSSTKFYSALHWNSMLVNTIYEKKISMQALKDYPLPWVLLLLIQNKNMLINTTKTVLVLGGQWRLVELVPEIILHRNKPENTNKLTTFYSLVSLKRLSVGYWRRNLESW